MSVEVHQDEVRPRLPRPDAGLALLLSLAVALVITLGEIDHLLSQVLDAGRTWSVNSLTGVTAVLHPGETLDGWEFFADRAQGVNGQVDGWLRIYAVTDLALACTYAVLGLAWFGRFRSRLGRAGAVLVVVGAAADAVENLLIGLGAPLGWLLLGLTAVKWLALLPAAVLALWTLRATLARLPKAFYTHRYSAAIVLPLAVLGLGRGPDLLEQIPDIQRAWADPGQHADFVWAGLVMTALVIATLFIGRQRTGHLWLRTCPTWTGDGHPCTDGECPVESTREREQAQQPLLRVWFIGPALLALAAAGLGLGGADIGGVRLLVFCTFPLAVGGLSLWLRRRWAGSAESRRPTRPPIGVRRFRTTALVGDVLVGLLPVVAGLGAIRAYAGPIALSGATPWSAFLFVAGWAVLLTAWPALAWAHHRLEEWGRGLPADFAADGPLERLLVQLTPGISMNRGQLPTDDPGADLADRVRTFLRGFAVQRTAWTVLLVSGVVLVLVGLLPVVLADTVGVIATFQLALGSLSVVVACTVILFQPGGSPEVFWPLRIPFAPVTTLVVLAMLFAATAGGDDVHRIRPYAGPHPGFAAADRPELGSVFETWLRTGRSCAQPLPGATDLKVRPLLLYAAEGGGIRAAYWTAAAIDRLSTPGSATGDTVKPVCRSALLASGASGGSVGLSVASVREPLMEISDDDVRSALSSLKAQSLVFEASSSRVTRFEHNFQRAAGVSEPQAVVLGLLMLRGPQTAAELRTNGDRWFRFADAAALEAVLQSLQQRGDDGGQPTVQKLPRAPGAREQRWVHLLCGEPDLPALLAGLPSAPDASDLLARVTTLENAVARLKADHARLHQHVVLISEQLGIALAPDAPPPAA